MHLIGRSEHEHLGFVSGFEQSAKTRGFTDSLMSQGVSINANRLLVPPLVARAAAHLPAPQLGVFCYWVSVTASSGQETVNIVSRASTRQCAVTRRTWGVLHQRYIQNIDDSWKAF